MRCQKKNSRRAGWSMDVVYLDSGVLVELLLGSEERRDIIKFIIAGNRRFRSVISFGEILYIAVLSYKH